MSSDNYGLKICGKCKVEKPFSKFSKRKDSRDGLRAQCKKCMNEYQGKWRETNKDHLKEYRKNYREIHPYKYTEKEKLHRKKYREQNKEHIQDYLLKYRYGISLDNVEMMIFNQDNHCAICNDEFMKTKDQYVDHNHITNQVRGLLCKRCNFGIGAFLDNPTILKSAIKYLEDN